MNKAFGSLIILIVLFSHCNSTAQNTSSIKVIKLGAPLCLTGHGSTFGERSRNGFTLAQRDLEGKYPFRFKIIYEDTKGEPRTAVSAVQKLLDTDKVKIILGPARSTNVMAVAPIVEKKKVILFTPVSSSAAISTAGDYVFRNRETGVPHGASMAEYLNSKGVSKVALFIAQSSNSFTYAEAFRKLFKGSIVFSSNYNPNNHDFRTEIVKAMSHKPDAFYLSAALDDDAVILINQIRGSGYTGLITGNPALSGHKLVTLAREASDGALYTAPVFDLDDPKVQKFQKDHWENFGEKGEFYSANAYDALFILAEAVNQCGGDSPDCIRDYLYSVKNYPGIGGLTTFDENGDVIKPVQIMTIRNGNFEKLE